MDKQIDIPTEVLAELTNNKLTSKEFRIFAYIATSKSEVNESTIDVIKNKFNYSKEEILKAIKKLSVEGLIN